MIHRLQTSPTLYNRSGSVNESGNIVHTLTVPDEPRYNVRNRGGMFGRLS